MQEGILPTVRVPGGRTVRVPIGALREWIEQNTGAGLERPQPIAAGSASPGSTPLEKEALEMPGDDQARSPNLIAQRYSDLSPSGQLLVSTMRHVHFGRFEGLRICDGEPVWIRHPIWSG